MKLRRLKAIYPEMTMTTLVDDPLPYGGKVHKQEVLTLIDTRMEYSPSKRSIEENKLPDYLRKLFDIKYDELRSMDRLQVRLKGNPGRW